MRGGARVSVNHCMAQTINTNGSQMGGQLRADRQAACFQLNAVALGQRTTATALTKTFKPTTIS